MLERPEPERAALIGGLYARGRALAELPADVESVPDDLVRAAADRRAPQGAWVSRRPSEWRGVNSS